MKHGIHIPAGVVRLAAIAFAAFFAVAVYHELPEARRYVKAERM